MPIKAVTLTQTLLSGQEAECNKILTSLSESQTLPGWGDESKEEGEVMSKLRKEPHLYLRLVRILIDTLACITTDAQKLCFTVVIHSEKI